MWARRRRRPQTFNVNPPAGLECADGTPNCELGIEADAKVTVTLVSSDCELAGNTFKVLITPPAGDAGRGDALHRRVQHAGRHELPAPERRRRSPRGPIITAQLVSGGNPDDLALPPALRLTDDSAYPSWTLEFDDGAHRPRSSDPDEPDFNDLVITVTATPQ